MKYVIIPEDVALMNRRTGKPIQVVRQDGEKPSDWVFTHEEFVLDHVCSDPRISAGGGDGARRLRKIEEAFLGCKPGDEIGVEDADYRVVMMVVGTLSWGPQFARHAAQLLPHIEAWEVADKQNDQWKRKREEEAKLRAVGDKELPGG
jgi:hypothetical protein